MKRQDFRVVHRLRVRWAEVDMQQVVFNAHYLMYMSTAMTEYWRALALPYDDTMRAVGGDFFVKKATLEFQASARLDDWLDIGVRCTQIGRSSMTIQGGFFCGPRWLAGSELVYVLVDAATQRPAPVPAAFRQLVNDHEQGLDIVNIQLGTWSECGQHARPVREAVFMGEQGIAADEEWDGADATSIHAVGFNRLGQPVATARLLVAEPGVARIGRVAVHRMLRGTGVGLRVMEAVMAYAKARGDHTARLSAQCSAQGFYERLGYRSTSDVYLDAGIAHVDMERPL